MSQAVFVTGLGLLSPGLDGKGLAPDPALGGLLSGRVTYPLAAGLPRLHAMALAAGHAALERAPSHAMIAPEEKAVFVSASKGGLEAFGGAQPELGPWLSRYLSNTPGQALRDRLQWLGGGRNTPLACATGAYAIGLAYEALKKGRLKAALAGAAEASLTPLVAASFKNLGALSPARSADEYAGPFDEGRQGFVLSEGAGVLFLENEAGLAQTSHRPLAQLLGWACSSDAYHLTAPEPQGAQAARCLSLALERSGIAPETLGYLNAHGTATPSGDLAEARALRQVFGAGPGPRVSSVKGAIGHALGAAGGIEAAVTVLALVKRQIPANLRCARPMAELADWLALKEETLRGKHAASLSMGFGGHNVALVFGQV